MAKKILCWLLIVLGVLFIIWKVPRCVISKRSAITGPGSGNLDRPPATDTWTVAQPGTNGSMVPAGKEMASVDVDANVTRAASETALKAVKQSAGTTGTVQTSSSEGAEEDNLLAENTPEAEQGQGIASGPPHNEATTGSVAGSEEKTPTMPTAQVEEPAEKTSAATTAPQEGGDDTGKTTPTVLDQGDNGESKKLGASLEDLHKGRNIVLEGVNFARNSSELTEESMFILDNVAKTLQHEDKLHVEIAGYTSSLGDAAYNRALSQRRAETVRQYLIDKGVAPDRLTAKGYGPDQPIADNDTPAGREKNRRVELH